MKLYKYKLIASNIGQVWSWIYQLPVYNHIELGQIPISIETTSSYVFYRLIDNNIYYIYITKALGLYHIDYSSTKEWIFPVQQPLLIERTVEEKKYAYLHV